MSENWAIRANQLGKRYFLGQGEQYLALRDVLAGIPRRLRGRGTETEPSSLWALRNVELDIPEGEVIGIVGRNGAGKSTLLKILSKITYPTTGTVEIRGRVGSLLEVGTGFHPELTGRENVFLNGAILGMTSVEIRQRFDQIVDFSGVASFLDTPVKRYSTGMYMRLAFAVAAHLEPEVLLVDEVLAVGDAEFQRRCLGRMRELTSSQGHTVVLVSHNLDAVSQLSARSVWLDQGSVRAVGPTPDVIDAYLRSREIGTQPAEWVEFDDRTRATGDEVRVRRARLLVAGGASRVESNEALALEIDLEATKATSLGSAVARFSTIGGTHLFDAGRDAVGTLEVPRGPSRVVIELDRLPIAPGSYSVDLIVSRVAGSGRRRGVFDVVGQALDVEVHATDRSPNIDGLIPVAAKVRVTGRDSDG